jgi:ketol-acid reductoisomerase
MPQHDLVPQPWRAFLMELDGLLTEPVELHCLGGFVVTMHYGLVRSTGDIDIVQIAPRGTRKTIIDVAKQGGELHQNTKSIWIM